MKLPANVSMARRRFLKRISTVLGLGLFAGARSAFGDGKEEDSAVVAFKVEEGEAIKTLREAARQANVEFILPAEMVRGIETRAIEGKFTPLNAFNRMLDGTPFVAFRHRKSGIYGIRKHPKRPKNKGSA